MLDLIESMFNGPEHFFAGIVVISIIGAPLFLICRWLWRAGSKKADQ